MASSEIKITYEGKTLTLDEWSVERGIGYNTLYGRYCRNLPIADVLSSVRLRAKPEWTLDAPRPEKGHRCFITLDGERRSYAEWSVIRGITVETISSRVKAGLPPEDVLKPSRRCMTVVVEKRRLSKPTTPFTRRSRLTFMAETMTVDEWSLDLGLSVSRVLSGLNAGESVEASLAKDPLPKAMGQKPRLARPVAAMRVPTLAELREMRQAA